ncbi:MAG: hypothetical protein ABL880_07275 [Methylotenera sp.]
MALNAEGYFHGLAEYLHKNFKIAGVANNKIVLEEKLYIDRGEVTQKVNLVYQGQVIVIKLDFEPKRKTKDKKDKDEDEFSGLFSFLANDAKPWAKRCDFVIFQLLKNKLNIYCVEFKSQTIPPDAPDQLKASVAWCKSLHAIIKSYTNESRQFNLKRFLFSNCENPAYFDADNKYLLRDNTIRHYLYKDVNGLNLSDLENTKVEIIK